jgi:hypothetical protein
VNDVWFDLDRVDEDGVATFLSKTKRSHWGYDFNIEADRSRLAKECEARQSPACELGILVHDPKSA